MILPSATSNMRELELSYTTPQRNNLYIPNETGEYSIRHEIMSLPHAVILFYNVGINVP